MSKELDAIITLAKQLVAAAPQLAEFEGLNNRIAEQKRAVGALGDTLRQHEQAVNSKIEEHSVVVAKTKTECADMVSKARKAAEDIKADAERQASSIVSAAQNQKQEILTSYDGKAAELDKIKEETKDAQAVLDNIRSILRGMGK